MANLSAEEIWTKLQSEVPADRKSHSGLPKDKIGALVKDLRMRLNLTPKLCADVLKVSPQTILRWEKGEIKQPQIMKLGALLENRAPSPPHLDAQPEEQECVNFDSLKLAIRPLSYILKRERDAAEVWLIKSCNPFLSGVFGPSRFEMVDFVRSREQKEHKEQNDHKLYFNFVFTNEPPTARESFDQLNRFLQKKEYADVRSNFRGFIIPDEDQNAKFELGLTATDAGWAVILYHEQNQHRLRREVDIFLEIPVAILRDPTENLTKPAEHTIWVELPSQRVEHLWRKWDRYFDSMRAGKSYSYKPKS